MDTSEDERVFEAITLAIQSGYINAARNMYYDFLQALRNEALVNKLIQFKVSDRIEQSEVDNGDEDKT